METIEKKQRKQIVKILNDALKDDRKAISRLLALRVECNEKLANHETIQCSFDDDKHTVGPLGLINGLLGIQETGWGYIAANFNVVCPNGCKEPGNSIYEKCSNCSTQLILGDIYEFVETDGWK